MRVALLAYHANLKKLYPKEWIKEYKESILNQTHKEIDIFEINYSGTKERIFKTSHFESIKMPTFIHALNRLLDRVFALGYECIANSNVDDIFSTERIKKQVPYVMSGYDIVASNFTRKYEDKKVNNIGYHYFDKLDIKKELSQNHNIVAHPCVTYSRNYIKHNRYIPEEQPYEDMKLWQRTIDDYNFIILPDFLFTHRIHNNSVCRSNNK